MVDLFDEATMKHYYGFIDEERENTDVTNYNNEKATTNYYESLFKVIDYFLNGEDLKVDDEVKNELDDILEAFEADVDENGINTEEIRRAFLLLDIKAFKNVNFPLDLIGIDYFSNTIYNLWYVVEKEYPKECKDLIFDLVKVFIFDIFMLNGDRHAGNYAIVEENGKPKIYIFDNESIFESVFRVELSPKYDKRDFLRNGTRIIRNPKATIGMKQNMELLEYFLTTSSNYFCKLVVDFYNKLAPEVVYSNILEKEKSTGIINHDKDYNMELLRRNYELIGDLLKDKGEFYMVHRPERLVDIFELMRKYKIEPKILKMVYSYKNKEPKLILIKKITK